MRLSIVLILASALLFGCSQEAEPPKSGEQTRPAPQRVEPKALNVQAPSGQYQVDLNHARLRFSVVHLGLSHYELRFTDFQASLQLNKEQPEQSSITLTIDPNSVRSDYVGDYKATHQDSPFDTWNEALAKSPKFLNAGEYPEISFVSTRVRPAGERSLEVEGNLTLLGTTKPMRLDVKIVGDAAEHPFSGVGAIGFSATGSFKRSDFGMTHLLNPPLVSDEVMVRFDGEFNQLVEAQGDDSQAE